MTELFTWEMLLTSAGAGIATGLIVQMFKEQVKLPTQIFSWLVATVVLLLATVFVVGLSPSALALCPFSALLVGGGASNIVSFAQRKSKE